MLNYFFGSKKRKSDGPGSSEKSAKAVTNQTNKLNEIADVQVTLPATSVSPHISLLETSNSSAIASHYTGFVTPTKIRFDSGRDDIETSMKKMEISPIISNNTDASSSANAVVAPWLRSYTTQEELRDIIYDEFGWKEQKTLKPSRNSHTATYAGYRCSAGCDFRANISLKKDSTWSLITESSKLKHQKTTDGVVYKCNGILKVKAKEIPKLPVIQLLVGQHVKHQTISDAGTALGALLTKDIIKKSYANKMPTRTEIEYSANYIEPYLDELKRLNPDCEVRVERVAGTDEFNRALVIPSYTKSLINDGYAYRVAGLDAGHMKDVILKKRVPKALLRKYHVTLLTGRLPGNTHVLYAYMISQRECSEDMDWMLQTMIDKG